jgi:hypothetical protein
VSREHCGPSHDRQRAAAGLIASRNFQEIRANTGLHRSGTGWSPPGENAVGMDHSRTPESPARAAFKERASGRLRAGRWAAVNLRRAPKLSRADQGRGGSVVMSTPVRPGDAICHL